MKRLLLSSIVLIVCCTAMRADIIFTLGNNPQPGEMNILLNSEGTGTLVMGQPNGDPSVIVDFASFQELLETSSGQASVSANPERSPLRNLTISLENGLTYGDLIINPFIGGRCTACTGGASTITVNAVASNGTPEVPFIFTGLNVGNGSNFLTIVASGGESIVSTSIDVPGGFADLRQPRISGPFNPIKVVPESGTGLNVGNGSTFTAVPEPGTFMLFGSGLGTISFGRKLRKTRA